MISALRRVFSAISVFDWITPAAAGVENVENGGPFADAWTFYVPYERALGCGWSEGDIDSLMGQYGVSTWGKLVHMGEYFFRVPMAQAAWAEYVLNNHGIPLAEKSQGAPRPRLTRKSNKNGHSEVSTS